MDEFDNMSLSQLLERLHVEQVKGLLRRITEDAATGSEFAAANQLLKNNNISVTPETNDEMNELRDKLDAIKARSKRVIASEKTDNVVQLKLGGGSGE